MQSSILITDDHSMIRKGLKLYLKMNLGVSEVTETASCHEMMMALKKDKYTHLILDIILSDGSSLEVIPTIRKLYPKLSIMVFSMQPQEVYGEALKQYGILYYLNKTAGEAEILKMLNQFLHNDQAVAEKQGKIQQQNPFSSLTPRELEVMHYMLQGLGTKETAELLNISMSTVSTLKNRIFEKSNSSNLKELLELATLYNVNY